MTSRERAYILPGLTREEAQLLRDMPRKASLADEIGFLRLRIRQAVQGGEEKQLVRMLELLTRMVSVQAKLEEPEGDELSELNELVRQRLVAAGFPDPRQDPTAAIRVLRRPRSKAT